MAESSNSFLNNPLFQSALMGGMGLGMFGQGLGSLFGNRRNDPMKGANQYLNQITGQLPGYFEPWMSAGKRMLPGLEEQFGQLMKDPGAMFNRFAGGYKQSPGYEWQQKQGQQAALNAAAAGGMAGTPMAQQNAAEISEQIANQDFYNYLSNVMGLYGMGLTGGQNISTSGLGASMGLGEDLASILQSQSKLAYTDAIRKQAEQSGGWGNLLGGLGTIGGMIFGGPMGSAIGGTVGKWLGG